MTDPNLFIVGVPRAATTSLAGALDQHPDVAVSAMKEPHFYVFPSVDESFSGPGDDWILRTWTRNESTYQAQFDGMAEAVRVDASTNYFHDPAALERIVSAHPAANFVLVLRRPEDRARSAHRFLQWQGHETLGFVDALAAEPDRITAGWSRIWRYAADSHYAASLQRFLSIVDPAQRLVLSFDELHNDWEQTRSAVQSFIGVDPQPLRLEQLNQKSAPPPKALAWLLNRPSDLRTKIGGSRLGPVLSPALAAGRRLASRAGNRDTVEIEAVPEQICDSWNRDVGDVERLLDRPLSHWRS